MNIHEKYYAINSAINKYLKSKSVDCPLIKYGIDRASVKANKKDTVENRYPYMQSHISNIQQQSWTAEANGILTKFDYQISFFTAPETEFTNDAKLFYPFELTKNILADTKLNILNNIAVIRRTRGHYESNLKSGQGVPSAFIIYSMTAVCTYEAIVPESGGSTEVTGSIEIKEK